MLLLPVRTFAGELPPFEFIAKRLVRYVQATGRLFLIPSRLLQHRQDNVFFCFVGCATADLL